MNNITIDEIFSTLDSRLGDEPIKSFAQIPKPETMKDLIRSAHKIVEDYKAGKQITIVGDYDADGVCASAILSSVLDGCQIKHSVIIPNRFTDGYGLSSSVIERIDSGLVITVDNGIGAVVVADLARQKGLDLIITDHHNCPAQLPNAYAIVNPKQPDCGFIYKDICGAMVAWYLAAVIRSILNPSIDMRSLLIYAMIATIADSVDLVGLNRFVAQAGLELMNRSNAPFVLALKALNDSQRLGFGDIAFIVAPRINAAGRMAEARFALEFLLCDSFAEAQKMALDLERFNTQRKEIESAIVQEAREMVHPDDGVLVVYGEDWHEGVIGIVASRLAEEYKKPTIVIAVENGKAKGSARTIGDLDLFNLISSAKDCLIGFGGHKKAAGLSIEPSRIEEFKRRLNASFKPDSVEMTKDGFLGRLDLDLITLELTQDLMRYEPFGEGNPRPIFFAESVPVATIRTMGRDSQHLRLSLVSASNNKVEAVAFNKASAYSGAHRISFFFELGINEYRGAQKVQIKVNEFVE